MYSRGRQLQNHKIIGFFKFRILQVYAEDMRFDSYTSNSILHILRIFLQPEKTTSVWRVTDISDRAIYVTKHKLLCIPPTPYSFRWVLRATKEAWDEMCVCIGVLSKKWGFPDFPTGLSMTYYDYRWGYNHYDESWSRSWCYREGLKRTISQSDW